MTRRSLTATVAVAALLLCAVPEALSAPLAPLASPVVAFSSDGVRYAAWQTSRQGPIVVLDTRSGRQMKFAAPGDCNLLDQGEGGSYVPTAAAGRVLISCVLQEREREQLLDMRTGAVTPLPAGTDWYALGARYVRGNDSHEHQVVRSLATGASRRAGDLEFTDLDRPGALGSRSVCPRLRARVGEEAEYLTGNFAYDDGVLARRLGERGQLEIALCDGQVDVLGGQRLSGGAHNHVPRDFDLRAGVLSWDTGSHEDTTGGGEGAPGERTFRARLNAIELPSWRHRSWTLPRVTLRGAERDSYGYSTHTANTVFWMATRTLAFGESGPSVQTYTLYSARL